MMLYGKVTEKIRNELAELLGANNVVQEKEALQDYSHDEFAPPWLTAYPEVVVKPQTTRQVSGIVKIAARERIPVTPRGGGTGLTGACVPLRGGMALSLEKMKKVVEIDGENMMATVEAGLTLGEFFGAIEERGLFFPPHPGDESAQIGGVIATNAGGARAVKYGVIRNFIKGLEVVMPDGTVLTMGGKLLKNSTGYSLMNLVIGSEGTLCVVTRAVVSLIAPPKSMATLIIPFEDLHRAVSVVPLIMKGGVLPMAVEFMEKDVIFVAEKYLGLAWPCRQGTADLMIILDGDGEEGIMKSAEAIADTCLANGAMDVFIAENRQKQAEILKIRSELYETMKAHTIEVLDVCVPRSSIATYVDRVHEIADRHGTWLPTVGHAADGNVHTQILDATWSNDSWVELPGVAWKEKYHQIVREIHQVGKDLGGVISGEHGIGLAKKQYLAASIGEEQVAVMRAIKKAIDPDSIMNPGKIFDMEPETAG
jgi:glycolate oxidase